MRTGLLVGLAAVCLVAGCSTEVERRDVDPVGRASQEVVETGPSLMPDPSAVVATAGMPAGWTTGRETALLVYRVPRRDWRDGGGRSALVLVTPTGRVVGRWASPRATWGWLEWSPAGDGFVGVMPYGRTRLMVRPGGVSSLTEEQGTRPYRDGDVRFGEGWLLDRSRATLTRERLPRNLCRGDVEVDLRDRTWCLDEEKTVVSWTDDHLTWDSHQLSTSHLEYCDGGTLGAELDLLGDQVVVGLYRADISTDRGLSWYDVDLPFEMVGAHRGQGGSFPNCTVVTPLRDGRLVLDYFGTARATDSTNTSFALVDFAEQYRVKNLAEGVYSGLRRGTREPYASYDGGTTWVPFRVPELLDALFDEQGG